jgi:ABC-type glycerol-3-phosphate transport system substrate-binding protein
MKRKTMTVLILATMGVLTFIGCSKEATPKGSGEVVINFHTFIGGSSSAPYFVSAWNAKNNGIRVVLNGIPNDEYDDKLKVLTASNADLDVMYIRTPAQAQQFINFNAFLDLTNLAKEAGTNLEAVRNTAMPGAMRDGKIYGLPMSSPAWILLYNKTLFDARNLPYPTSITWDQYMDLSNQLTYTENGKKYWGGLIPPWTMNLGASSGGEYLTADTLPLTRKYAEVLYRVYTQDHSHPDIGEMGTGTFDPFAAFESGNVYMMINGDWSFAYVKPEFELGVGQLPVFPEVARGSSVGNPTYYVISANSKHPKEAYQFLEWLCTSDEGTSILATYQNEVPAFFTDAAQTVYSQEIKAFGMENRFSEKVSPEQGNESYYGALNDAFIQELQLYLLKEQSLDAMFDNFFKLRKEIVAR